MAEAGCEENKGAKSGETGTRPLEKKTQMTLVKWSTNPTHGAEETEKTMKKDRAHVLDMDGPVPNNEEGDGAWKEQCEVGVSG